MDVPDSPREVAPIAQRSYIRRDRIPGSQAHSGRGCIFYGKRLPDFVYIALAFAPFNRYMYRHHLTPPIACLLFVPLLQFSCRRTLCFKVRLQVL